MNTKLFHLIIYLYPSLSLELFDVSLSNTPPHFGYLTFVLHQLHKTRNKVTEKTQCPAAMAPHAYISIWSGSQIYCYICNAFEMNTVDVLCTTFACHFTSWTHLLRSKWEKGTTESTQAYVCNETQTLNVNHGDICMSNECVNTIRWLVVNEITRMLCFLAFCA